MNEDELKQLWQQQPLRHPDISPAQLVSAMQKKMTGLRRSLQRRDFGELVACALIVVIFGIFYFTVHHTPVSRLGDLIIIGSAIFIAFKLVYTRRTAPPAPPGATIVESLQAELHSVRTQSRLLGSILWWYLLPLAVGLFLCTWGSPVGLAIKISYSIFVIALYAFIYWLNQRARSKQFLPLEGQLESLLHSAKTGQPLEQTHFDNLRPIVLSMAAASQVKPAEFKVAFWQIALYGEIGFIGIWFFWILSLTLGDHDWKRPEESLNSLAPVFQLQETNRYSVMARKIIEPLNNGDHAAVQKMFNQGMSKALPPDKASDFFIKLSTGFGKVGKVQGPIGDGYRGWIAFRLQCQRGELIMSLALDAEDKISGLHFKPGSRPSRTLKEFASQMFTLPHLLWLGPFFLAGLLYSWLLQKTTERAVGISSLGVHLNKGEHLLLWDEIKDVRPAGFLNFRNLWLLKESGEKTIMHWTPLERHAELKAAVEKFAPSNHPIRKYLSLLN